jgi:hypothetical protein
LDGDDDSEWLHRGQLTQNNEKTGTSYLQFDIITCILNDIVILNDAGRCQYTFILKFNIMIYWHYLRIIQFYLLKVIYIVLYIFGPVATHGHAPSVGRSRKKDGEKCCPTFFKKVVDETKNVGRRKKCWSKKCSRFL